jgi:acetyltransferase
MTDIFELRQKNLEKIFYPDSVAIVGANKVQGTVPSDILMNILKADFNGIVFPVSPREKFIAGIKSHKYVIDIEDQIDLAIIVFPSSVCHLALEQCGQKGIRSAIIISAGFKEVGGIGIEREEKIKEIARKYDISFIGPNCLGVINTDPQAKFNASFSRRMPEEGNIGFLSQSGALCTAVLDYAYAKHIGFSKFVSFGNKADITEIDLLYYLKDDPKTKVILLYLEEVTNGPELMNAARDVIQQSGKPVLILKSGRTKEGASAAASHTGSLAGSDEICDAAFKQAGIIRCENIEDMFNRAIAFAYQPVPKSNRVAIVTNAGGPGVLTTDAAVQEGLQIAKFSDRSKQILKKSLPNTANINNPVDVIGDARVDRYNVALKTAFEDENVDGVFVILTPQSMTDIDLIAREVAKVSSHYDKPVYASFMGEADVAAGIEVLQRNKIPHYFLPESMAVAFASVYNFEKMREMITIEPEIFADVNKRKVKSILTNAEKSGKTFLSEEDSLGVLSAYGLPVLETIIAKSRNEAIKASEKVGYPVVMKVVSDQVVHKTEVRGVLLNIKNSEEAGNAYNSIIKNVKELKPKAEIKGILIRKMIPQGEEVILGIKRDPSFNAVIMFGLGGIYVELFKDVTFRAAPVDKLSALSMIKEIIAYPILAGFRGNKVRDIESIVRCIQRISQLAIDFPQIKELDINPLITLEESKGSFVADARIIL